jgi:tetratricopeptide (TPR) repeat protein
VEYRGESFEEVLAQGEQLLEQDPQGALDRAEILLRWPPHPRTFQLAAAAMRKLGHLADAEQSELSGIKASFAVRALEEAALAGRDGQQEYARSILESFLSSEPENLLALTMAAELDIEDWHLEAAERRLRVVLERAPSFLRAIMLMGRCLTSLARNKEATALLEEVVRRKPNNITTLRNLGQLYAEANRIDKAAELDARVVEVDPSLIEMWVVLGQHLRMLGRKDESKAAFRRAIELNPNSGGAWWGLANYFPSAITETDVEAMHKVLSNSALGSPERGSLSIALGLLAERRGEFAEAFRFISEGKRFRAESHPFDADLQSSNVDKTISTFNPELFDSMRSAGDPDDSPIFIIGMPRSGTTLLERILSGHSQIEAAGELLVLPRIDEHLRKESPLPYDELIASMSAEDIRNLGRRYIDRARDYRTTAKKHFIDKLNNNWMRLGLIRLILPKARIIDLRRNALDCCWSNFKMLFAEGAHAANDQRDIARYYKDYVRMVEAVDSAAPGAILQVKYEDLVDEPEAQTRRILQFLGLDYEPACMDFHLSTAAVATPSSEQVRRPINREGIGSADPFREWLGPMIEELGELAD